MPCVCVPGGHIVISAVPGTGRLDADKKMTLLLSQINKQMDFNDSFYVSFSLSCHLIMMKGFVHHNDPRSYTLLL